jgi:hypothetical protein
MACHLGIRDQADLLERLDDLHHGTTDVGGVGSPS